MVYTNNTPQATQTIASTQPLIQDNFAFLDTGLQQEHNFTAAGTGSDMYHLKASMPNQVDPGSIPAGTNGQYYVSGGLPKFFNTAASFIQISTVPYSILTGTAALITTDVNVVVIPQNAVGQYYLFRKSSSNTVNTSSAAGLFITDNTTLFLANTSAFDPGINVSNVGRTLRASTANASFNDTYTYLIVYFNP
jgi:hypothetical protein